MLHVIIGGSGSGKSAYAEQQIAEGCAPRLYIATMHPYDEESYARIRRHRLMREKKQFETRECYTGLRHEEIPPGCDVLLECMSNLVANEIYEPDGAKERTVPEILAGIDRLCRISARLIVVTNDTFADGVSRYEEETLRYLRMLGEVNQGMAARADCVTEVVYGIPVRIKPGPV